MREILHTATGHQTYQSVISEVIVASLEISMLETKYSVSRLKSGYGIRKRAAYQMIGGRYKGARRSNLISRKAHHAHLMNEPQKYWCGSSRRYVPSLVCQKANRLCKGPCCMMHKESIHRYGMFIRQTTLTVSLKVRGSSSIKKPEVSWSIFDVFRDKFVGLEPQQCDSVAYRSPRLWAAGRSTIRRVFPQQFKSRGGI